MLPASIIIEIFIVGFIVAISISPLLFILEINKQKKLSDILIDISIRSKELLIFLVLVIYILGIIGNRISDDVTEVLYDLPVIELLKLKSLNSDKWSKNELLKKFKESNKDSQLNKDDVYKILEFRVLENNNGITPWFERSKSFVRVLRALSFYSFNMIILMLLTKLSPINKNIYSWKAYLFVGLIFLISDYSWRSETYKYQERIAMSCMMVVKNCITIESSVAMK